MAKVYPGGNTASSVLPDSDHNENYNITNDVGNAKNPTMLTVWKKSLLFNSDGFTVIDAQGNLVYRIDNYVPGTDIVLMDASGNSLLTIRRKKRRLGVDSMWLVFEGEAVDKPMFEVRKNTNLLSNNNKSLAHVRTNSGTRNKCTNLVEHDIERRRVYEIDGSFCRRSCGVYDVKGRKVAEIKQKEAPVTGVTLGMDIFTLVIQPGLIDNALAMAIVVLLDQMYGSSSTSRQRF